VKREEIERGQVLSKPGSITPHTKFKAEVYCLTKDEGGRHTPFFNGYRPQFYFRTTDVTGVCQLPEGTEMVMPGDNTQMEIELIQPIAMDEALRFAIREGGRTVGSGVGHRHHRVASEIREGRTPAPLFFVSRSQDRAGRGRIEAAAPVARQNRKHMAAIRRTRSGSGSRPTTTTPSTARRRDRRRRPSAPARPSSGPCRCPPRRTSTS
jgi:hypothetical protein